MQTKFRQALLEAVGTKEVVYDDQDTFEKVIGDWLDSLEPYERVLMWNEFSKKGFHNGYLYDNDDEGIAQLIKDYRMDGEEIEKAFGRENRNYRPWHNFVANIVGVVISTDNFEEVFGYDSLIYCIVGDKFKVSKKYGFEAKLTDELFKKMMKKRDFKVYHY